jgi:hypothetical protein
VGRWAHLKGVVPEIQTAAESEEAESLERSLRALHAGESLDVLADALTTSRATRDRLNEELGEVNTAIRVIEKLIIEKLDAAGIESVTVGGYKLTPSIEPNFRKVDGERLRAWVRETGQEDLLTVHSQTLAALAKDYYQEHNEAPPGTEMSGYYTKLSRTKAR